MGINNLNAEQEALLDQLQLPKGISIKEIIKEIESINIVDTEPFEKRFNESMVQAAIDSLKNMIL